MLTQEKVNLKMAGNLSGIFTSNCPTPLQGWQQSLCVCVCVCVQGQGGGALTWSVAAHWVHWLWGFPGSVG